MKKESTKKAAKKSPYVIVRGDRSGVFAGSLVKRTGREVTLDNCRRLWYWDGAASLSQIATCGVSAPNNCKFSVRTNGHEILDAIEIIPATEVAEKNINEVKEWKR